MATNIRWQILLTIFAILLLLLPLGYMVYAQSLVVVPKRGGTYSEGLAGGPTYLNPILSQYNEVDRDLCRLIFDGLMQTDSHGQLDYNLARWMDLSEDGLSYTFYLRDDVRWHDGQPFTARDVLFTFQAIQDPQYRGPGSLAAFWQDVQVELVNTYTIRFTLPQPFAPFPSYLTLGILPAHLLAKIPAQSLPNQPFNSEPVGTGSWRFVEMDVEHIVLERNPDDYRPAPYLDRLEFKFYANYQALLEAYRQEEVDGISHLRVEDLPRVWEDESLNIYSAPLSGCSLVYLNLKSPLFQDKALRQALLYALDRRGAIDQVLKGQGVVAHSPIVPFSWAYDQAVKQYPYDPEQADQLLDQMGWVENQSAGGRYRGSKRLAFTLLTTDDPTHIRMGQELVRQWSVVGVQVQLQVVEVSKLIRDHLKPRHFEAVLYEWQRLPTDPDPYALWHSTQAVDPGQNLGGLADEKLDMLLEEARLNRDAALRQRLYGEFQQRFAEEVPALLLYYPIYHYALSKRVNQVQIGPVWEPADRFRTLPEWYVLTQRILASEARSTPTQLFTPMPTVRTP